MTTTQDIQNATYNRFELDFQRHGTFQEAMSAASDEERERLQSGIDYLGEHRAKGKIEKLNSLAMWWCTIQGKVFYLYVTPREGLRLLNDVTLTFSAMTSGPFQVIEVDPSDEKAGVRRFERDLDDFAKGSPLLLSRDMNHRRDYAKAGIIVTTHNLS